MRLRWALLLGALAGIAVAWWLSRDTPAQTHARQTRADNAAAANIEDARPVIYRWRDEAGTLHVTSSAPKGRKYERIPIEPEAGIEVRGDRQ